MRKSRFPVIALGITVIGMSACKNGDGFKTKDGLDYKIVSHGSSEKKPMIGDYLSMHIHGHILAEINGKKVDTALFDSRKMNHDEPVSFPLMAPQFHGDPNAGFAMLSEGDSAVFRVPVDSLKKIGMQLTPWMKSGDKIEYDVKVISIKSKADVTREAQEKAAKQKGTDDQTLQSYFSQNNLKPEKTASGVYYIIQKPGSGEQIKTGQTVTVNYTGRTLDGQIFDSNTDPAKGHVKPFSFKIGSGEVIPGWDEGVSHLKKGSVAKIFVPSALGYGTQSPSPALPANSILMFDIEVTDVK